MTKLAITILSAVFIANMFLTAGAHDWYVRHDFVATIFHLSSGALVGLLLYSFYHKQFIKVSQPTRLYFLVGMVVIIGVTWEFSEFIFNYMTMTYHYQFWHSYGPFIGDLRDTLSDISMDMLGGLLFGLTTLKSKI